MKTSHEVDLKAANDCADILERNGLPTGAVILRKLASTLAAQHATIETQRLVIKDAMIRLNDLRKLPPNYARSAAFYILAGVALGLWLGGAV